MTFSIEKSKLPSFKDYFFETITVELYQQDADAVWEINWKSECLATYRGGDCWTFKTDELPRYQRDELESYIAANQAEIEKQAQEIREADRADYEYGKYMEDRGI